MMDQRAAWIGEGGLDELAVLLALDGVTAVAHDVDRLALGGLHERRDRARDVEVVVDRVELPLHRRANGGGRDVARRRRRCDRRRPRVRRGRRAHAAGIAMQIVHLQDPRLPPGLFDALIVPAHDPARGGNVLVTTGSLNRLTLAGMQRAMMDLPTRWLSEENFYADEEAYMPVPDPDAEGMRILEWPMEPGDAVAFDFRVLHGARGNESDIRRRAFSLRLIGDDARYVERPGRTSPPFPGHGMRPGDRLREDWFPTIFRRSDDLSGREAAGA